MCKLYGTFFQFFLYFIHTEQWLNTMFKLLLLLFFFFFFPKKKISLLLIMSSIFISISDQQVCKNSTHIAVSITF